MRRALHAVWLPLLFGVAACGGVGEARRTDDAVRLPIINDPIFNPLLAPDLGSVMVNKVLFPGLVRPDESLRPTPDLALSWQVSLDGLAYTFALRPNVKWHDGAPFTARDVKFTLDQITSATSGSRLRSDFDAVAGTDIIDSLTVRIRLKAPFAPLLTLLGYNAGMLPEHLLRGDKLTGFTAFNRSTPVGTGPFKVEMATPGSSVTLARNNAYYGTRPGAGRIVFKVVPDINAQVAQLRAGELDLITIEPANLGSVQNAEGVRVLEVPVVQHWYVGFNAALPMFARATVRRALGYAVNRDAIVKGVLKGYGDLPGGTIPAALRDFHDATAPRAPFAPDSAKALLAAAGWIAGADGKLRDARGAPFTFELLVDKGNPTREQSALAVQQDLARIGVTATIRTMEFAALVRDRLLPGKYDATMIWWTTPPDPDQFSFYHTAQDNNNVRYSNRMADSLLALGRATTDSLRRREIYRAFQAVERADPPVLVLFYPREIQAVSSRLQNVPKLGIRDALRHSEQFRVDK